MSKRFPPIPRFVTPLQDENCYSILSRCMVYAAMPTSKLCLELFGRRRVLSNFLWQSFRPEDMAQWFDDDKERTAEYLREHSCVPYRISFVEKRTQVYLNDWHDGEPLSNGHYKRVTRMLGYKCWKKEYLFYCPECVRTDRDEYGETYWHMTAQLPGVTVCPVHMEPLMQSDLKVKDTKYELHPAEYCIPKSCKAGKEKISYDDLQIARDSKWMMENGWKNKDHDLPDLVKGLSTWDYEMAEATVKRYSTQSNAKTETLYYILLAKAHGESISTFMR